MSTWETIALAIGGNAALLGVLGILAKSLLEKIIARDSKQFEADLKARADLAIEQLRNSLQLRTIEHQVRFSKLHEKRAEVIAELYRLLRIALWNSESFLSPMQWAGDPEPKQKHADAMNSIVDAYRYLGEHQIYLPHVLCVSLEKLIRDARGEVIKLGVWLPHHEASLPTHSQEQKQKMWDEAWKSISQDIPVGLRALEDEFRNLLGASAQLSSSSGSTASVD